MLQMGQLLSPFDTEVDVNSELDDMPEDVTVRADLSVTVYYIHSLFY